MNEIYYTLRICKSVQGKLHTNDIEVIFFYEDENGDEVFFSIEEACEKLSKLEIVRSAK